VNRRLGVAEILKEISRIKDINERQNALASCYNTKAIIQILHAMFHPDVKFLLPEGEPPYKKLEKSTDSQGSLYREARRLYLFIEGLSPPNLSQVRRETQFVQMLEVLDPEDAALLIAVKDKKCPYPGITYELVYNTFPKLLPEPRENPKERKLPCPFGCKSSERGGKFTEESLAQHIEAEHGPSSQSQTND
jgi:hypothetical protein